LSHVLGILAMAKHAITQPKNLAAKTLDEFQRRVLLSGKAATN
jgi:hypothetical protein